MPIFYRSKLKYGMMFRICFKILSKEVKEKGEDEINKANVAKL